MARCYLFGQNPQKFPKKIKFQEKFCVKKTRKFCVKTCKKLNKNCLKKFRFKK